MVYNLIGSNMNISARHWFLLTLLSILWGGAFFFAAVAVGEIPPLTLVFFRVFIAAFTLLVFVVFAEQTIPKSFNLWVAFFYHGFFK